MYVYAGTISDDSEGEVILPVFDDEYDLYDPTEEPTEEPEPLPSLQSAPTQVPPVKATPQLLAGGEISLQEFLASVLVSRHHRGRGNALLMKNWTSSSRGAAAV